MYPDLGSVCVALCSVHLQVSCARGKVRAWRPVEVVSSRLLIMTYTIMLRCFVLFLLFFFERLMTGVYLACSYNFGMYIKRRPCGKRGGHLSSLYSNAYLCHCMLKTLKGYCKYFSCFYYVSFTMYSLTTDWAKHCAGSNGQEMTQATTTLSTTLIWGTCIPHVHMG